MPSRVMLSSSTRMTSMSIMGALGRPLQAQGEFGASFRPIAALQVAPELARNAARNGEPEAEALAGLFGRRERLEQARQLRFGDPRAVVAHGDIDPLPR